MRVLLIKTSSMGDIIHTLPALTDAGRALPGIKFDWVVEEAFSSIPTWHPLVNRVIPVALRRWRKGVFKAETRSGWKQLRAQLSEQKYNLILDAQGLVKSAALTYLTPGERVGLDWQSAREPLASLAYQRKCTVNFYQHAIVRMRSLFSQALAYELPNAAPDFGINKSLFQQQTTAEKYIVFLFGTTWSSKQWPETYWRHLAELAHAAGYRIKVSGHHPDEIATAERIGAQNPGVDVLPRLDIASMTSLLVHANAVVAVDTGFGHLAAALAVPTVSIYGSTNAEYTGALGVKSVHLSANFPCSPCLNRDCKFKGESVVKPACYATVDPLRVWAAVNLLLG